MADHILVTFGALADAQANTSMCHSNLNNQLADLKAYLAPLVASWEGNAATTYQGHQAQWDTAVTELNAVLATISAAIGQAQGNYQTTENTNAAMWG